MNQKAIIDSISKWAQNTLVETQQLTILSLGNFCTIYSPERVVVTQKDRFLVPPFIKIGYKASRTFLDANTYSGPGLPLFEQHFSPLEQKYLTEYLGLSGNDLQGILHEYFGERYQLLVEGRRTDILDLGDFFVTEKENNQLILSYTPSVSLIQKANRAFEDYQPTELQKGVDFAELSHIYTDTIEDHLQHELEERVIIQSITRSEIRVPDTASTAEKQEEIFIPPASSTQPEIAPKKKRLPLFPYLSTAALLVIFAIVVYTFLPKQQSPSATPITIPVPQEEEITDRTTINLEVKKNAMHAPAQDTVKMLSGNSLNKFAHKYYGQQDFWVYIYMANKVRIKNPDNIPIGTTLLIPNLSYFELNPDSVRAVKEARLWATRILTGKYDEYFSDRLQVAVP